MFISTCGFGSTGSSSVTDYLRECDGVQVIDNFEFPIAPQVDGLEDLEYHLMLRNSRQASSIYAIQRFEKMIGSRKKKWCAGTDITPEKVDEITGRFLDSITQVKYTGFSPRINERHSEFFQKKIGESLIRRKIMPHLERKGIVKENIDFYPLSEVRVSVRPEGFYEAAQRFITELLEGMGADMSSSVAMDQAFSGNDPAKSFPFFPDPYAVVVDRDPRDIYIFAKKKLLSFGRFMPSDNVGSFVAYYKILRDGQPYKEKNHRILNIRFEDMVYNYKDTTQKINEFLGVESRSPKSVFEPAKSIANTNLVKRFPEFTEEAEIIADALPEYIFHFEDYPEADNSGRMFYGRALKQK